MISTFRKSRFLLAVSVVSFFMAACSTNPSATHAISWDHSLATPGAQIKFEKASESSYEMRVFGLPNDKDYVLYTKWLDGRIGTWPIPDANALFEGKITFDYDNFVRGEPIDYALISSDASVRVYARFTPYPLEAKSERGCRLVMTLLSSNGRHFGIMGEGFRQGEQVLTISRSDSEVIEKKGAALEDGRIAGFVDPGGVGKTGGVATFQASSETCDVTIRYEWGTAMTKMKRIRK